MTALAAPHGSQSRYWCKWNAAKEEPTSSCREPRLGSSLAGHIFDRVAEPGMYFRRTNPMLTWATPGSWLRSPAQALARTGRRVGFGFVFPGRVFTIG